jgi:hypothetical protein
MTYHLCERIIHKPILPTLTCPGVILANPSFDLSDKLVRMPMTVAFQDAKRARTELHCIVVLGMQFETKLRRSSVGLEIQPQL